MLRLLLLAALALPMASPPAAAQAPPGGGAGITAGGGVQRVAFRLGRWTQAGYDRGSGASGRVSYAFSDFISVYGEGGSAGLDSSIEIVRPYALSYLNVGALLTYEAEQRLAPFVIVGLTTVHAGFQRGNRYGLGVVAGGGLAFRAAGGLAVRGEITASRGELRSAPAHINRTDFRTVTLGVGAQYTF